MTDDFAEPDFIPQVVKKFITFSLKIPCFLFKLLNKICRKEILKSTPKCNVQMMKNDVYRRLQRELDKLPVPFPPTESGIEIKLLKSLFTEEEAEVAIHLSALPEKVSKIHKRLKKRYSEHELENMLRQMVKKGSIHGMQDKKEKGKLLFSKMPLAIGMFEAQVDRISRDVAESFYKYEEEGFADAVLGTKTLQMRTIPLNIKIEPDFHVSNYDDISKIIKDSPGPFAVMNCICRQAKDKLDKPCKATEIRETCILLEGGVEFAKILGVGREISKEETLRLITRAKKIGLVLQPENNQRPHFVCCCCGCCCGVLTAAKFYDRPAEFLHSNHYAQVTPEKCTLCETCLDRCQMDAFVRVNNHMEINTDRCIGCAACIPTCKGRAIRLIRKKNVTVPPKTSGDMYKKIMIERFGLWKTAKVAAKAALGKKV